jgi:hypothetical protein
MVRPDGRQEMRDRGVQCSAGSIVLPVPEQGAPESKVYRAENGRPLPGVLM